MSHNHTAYNVNPLTIPQSVERNGVTGTLSCFVGKRGAWDKRPYQAYQLATDGTESAVADDSIFISGLQFIGKVNVERAINAIFRRYGQDFVDDATGDADTEKAGGLADGVFSLEKFLDMWKNLKSSALKFSELMEAYQNEVTIHTDLTNQLMAAFDRRETEPDAINEINALRPKITAANATITSLRAEYEERKAKRSKEAAAETVTPE